MAEPVGFAASIITLLELTKGVLEYIRDAYNAINERKKLSDEIESTQRLLEQLNLKSEEAKWGDTMKVLTIPGGPLQQFETQLKQLEKCLAPSNSQWKKLGTALKWPLNRKATEEIFTSLERFKSLLTIALQRDLM